MRRKLSCFCLGIPCPAISRTRGRCGAYGPTPVLCAHLSSCRMGSKTPSSPSIHLAGSPVLLLPETAIEKLFIMYLRKCLLQEPWLGPQSKSPLRWEEPGALSQHNFFPRSALARSWTWAPELRVKSKQSDMGHRYPASYLPL